MVNSVYAPLSLAAPVLLEGRLLLQQLVAMGKRTKSAEPLGWDDPFPKRLASEWQRSKNALLDL